MKLAIVYDWLDKYGGAERILTLLFNHFPEADIYTLYVDLKKAKWARAYAKQIHPTFLQRFYDLGLPKSWLAPLMPFAIESLNLSDYDKILSLSSSFAKGVISRPESRHICYLFAPTRFLWHHTHRFFSRRLFWQPFLGFLRQWDSVAAQRPDKILTLSNYDQNLITKFYGRTSQILYPPFAKGYWKSLKPKRPEAKIPKQFFLVVSRLEPYKRADLVIRTFNQLQNVNLIVVGQGTEAQKLKKLAKANTLLLKEVNDNELAWLYQHAEALIMPQEEDFGYTALEAIFYHCPVIAYEKSGTAEILKNTGFLFKEQTIKALTAAVENYHTKSYNFSKFAWEKYQPERFLRDLKRNISFKS